MAIPKSNTAQQTASYVRPFVVDMVQADKVGHCVFASVVLLLELGKRCER